MVVLSKIYTKTGDAGETALGNGARVAKHATRVSAYGTVDETNSAIGLARLHTVGGHDDMLRRIQHDLFDLGADLSTPYGPPPDKALRITEVQVKRLEDEIDRMNESLSPLNSFVLPGGSPAAACLHVARTIARRAERIICELATVETINPVAIHYINRLSDFLFVLSRAANGNGSKDVLWEPGINR